MDVTIPSVGESVSEGTIGRWYFKSGDIVQKDQALFELDSDKASMEVTADATGKLEILVSEGETAQVGSTVARIHTSVTQGVEPSETSQPSAKTTRKATENGGNGKSKKAVASSQQEDETTDAIAQKRAAANLDAVEEESSRVIRSGPETAEDLRDLTPSQRKAVRSGKVDLEQIKAPALGYTEPEARRPMTTIRKRIAERLLESQHTTATLTTFNEVDMTRILEVRKKLKDSFQKTHGVKLGFMSFFSKAVVEAIAEYAIVNSHIEGGDIVEPSGVHLGIAVSTPRGLVVPVIRHAERLSYGDLEIRIASLAEKARDGKLSIPDMQGGTFTLTNGGVFGSLLSTPILNPPQSAILGMHKTEMRPIAIEGKNGKFDVAVRPMMYLALSYDHRLIDGKTSVGFLVKIKEYLEGVTEDDVNA